MFYFTYIFNKIKNQLVRIFSERLTLNIEWMLIHFKKLFSYSNICKSASRNLVTCFNDATECYQSREWNFK